jgi:hypothetical protein
MANKYIAMVAGLLTEVAAIITSAGAGDSGKIVALDSSGKLDTSFMPTGVGADTAAIATSESLAAGDLVNVFNSTGAKVRKADSSVSGKEAHGFVLAVFTHPTTATVYFEGSNTQVTGLTPGVQYLDPPRKEYQHSAHDRWSSRSARRLRDGCGCSQFPV